MEGYRDYGEGRVAILAAGMEKFALYTYQYRFFIERFRD